MQSDIPDPIFAAIFATVIPIVVTNELLQLGWWRIISKRDDADLYAMLRAPWHIIGRSIGMCFGLTGFWWVYMTGYWPYRTNSGLLQCGVEYLVGLGIIWHVHKNRFAVIGSSRKQPTKRT